MRSIQTLGLTCIAAFSCAAAAENALQTMPGATTTAHVDLDRRATASWPARADRLRYLSGGRCLEHYGCSTSAAAPQPRDPEPDYIDALDLGDYGPMDFKFTGDRVKLKVKF